MDTKNIARIFEETAYIHTGGSPEELKAAQYLQAECAKFGGEAILEAFRVDMAEIHSATLWADGMEIPCKGYLCAGSGTIEAPLYYLTDNTPYALSQCKGKIVMFDGYLGYWRYQDLLEKGAVGFITYDGNANYVDNDIDQRELRSWVAKGNKMLGVNINAKDAIKLVRDGIQTVKIQIEQTESTADSHNVVLNLPGEIDQYIVLTAHYDTTPLSQGAYDNMSGSIGLLALAEAYMNKPHRYGLRFIWCGSEERGLLGSKAYCADHESELEKIAFVVNLDMIGCIMGKFIACCTSEDKLVSYLRYFAAEEGFVCAPYQDVYSSDSTPFADKGIPAVSFARAAPGNTATIHNSYDTRAVMSPVQMEKDIAFIGTFLERMVNAQLCPVAREMPDNMKEKLDEYLTRKRPAQA